MICKSIRFKILWFLAPVVVRTISSGEKVECFTPLPFVYFDPRRYSKLFVFSSRNAQSVHAQNFSLSYSTYQSNFSHNVCAENTVFGVMVLYGGFLIIF